MSDGQNPNNATSTKASRGFGAMDPQKQKEIAQRGGRAAHAKGVAHKYSVDEARSAGRKGGQAISANRAHMSEIGRLGGLARRAVRPNETPTKAEPADSNMESAAPSEGRQRSHENSDSHRGAPSPDASNIGKNH